MDAAVLHGPCHNQRGRMAIRMARPLGWGKDIAMADLDEQTA
jgi:hypothetical protein